MAKLRGVFASVGDRVQERPVATLALAVLLILVSVGGAAQITSVTGNAAFVAENPTYEAYSESFDHGNVAVLVRGDVTEPATIRAIDRLDRRMSETQNVYSVTSPADRVRAEYGRIPDSERKIEAVLGSPDYAIVGVTTDTGLSQQEERPIYDRAVDVKQWANFPAGVSVTVTGSAAFSAQMSAVIQQSTSQLLGLAVGLMVVALFFLFRGVRLRLLPIVAVFVGVIYTFGAIGYAGIPNSTLTSAVFPILIGLGIDYSVQFHERYEEELERNPPRTALPIALGGIGPPVLIAMLAAALGFAATWVSTTSPATIWFAQTSILGVMLTYAAGILVLLSVLTIYVRWRFDGEFDHEADADGDGDDAESTEDRLASVGTVGLLLGRSSRVFASHPKTVLVLALVLAGAGFQVSSSLDTMTDTNEFIPQDLPAYVDLQQFQSVTGGGSSTSYSVLVTGTDLRDPEVLRWMVQFEDVATEAPLITGVDSPATLVKQYNGGEIPETEAGVNRVLADVPEKTLEQYYNDGRAHVTIATAQDMTTGQVISFLGNAEDAIAYSNPPPGVTAEVTGTAAISTPSIVSQINSRNVTTALGVLFVLLLLLAYYRDPVKAVAPLVPMVFVLGWQNIYMYELGISVSPLGASLGAMTVGIGAEYTIIVMERYYEEKAREGVSRLDAVQIASARVGKAISVSGMTTVFGFSALILSPFPILSGFGFLTVGVIFLTLIASLATLPPTLVLLDGVAERVADYRASRGQPA
ncbi:hydrophobe/amphiphile efflux-3 (HAE3) family protein [Halarchaeum rubridurum]|uniref:Hydrophobe/amphiphile efflux-3 (HAE3) family protein n=1 Tax=Halarchaeum rubridurum TaxID=489911 RepID=A0A830G0T4_9EURY|nr:RND family transporter [Halarchaeum rubridurum]MBP1954987.1 hydrophobe/amphiphile efflux-3 (HAE3) family protein [Halarchaeum rubridurum]GGM69923.1 RND transporter [Halarchaeum rubridurum]